MVNVTLLKEQNVDAFSQAEVPEMLSNQSLRTPSFEAVNERDPIPSGTVVPYQADRVVSIPFFNSVVIATDWPSSLAHARQCSDGHFLNDCSSPGTMG